ncbi:MAG TPA: hypothetical protein VKV05_10355 [Terriglobales bacterium]|nr:hypothetical protein [Terriglobales bacterium]
MALCISVFGLGVAALAFGAVGRPDPAEPEFHPEVAVRPAIPARFFSDIVLPVKPHPPLVPIEVLLQQIENHVRLEQAAAESFVAFPTQALLHCKTTSALVN